MADVYDGKVYGIFEPLKVSQEPEAIVVRGGTFVLKVSRRSGQIVSAAVEGTEFIAPGSSMPNPYIGLFPPDEPGATAIGGRDRARFAHELAAEIHPKLFSGGLTASHRYDAADSPADEVKVVRADEDRVVLRSRGRYGETTVRWEVEFDVDVDGFTKVTVRTTTDKPVLLRWSCFNHVSIDAGPVEFIVPWTDVGLEQLTGFRGQPTRLTAGAKPGDLVFGAHLNPFFHLGNPATGIEFSKEDFRDRYSGYRDSTVILEDGTKVNTDAVEMEDGRTLGGSDSRGRRRFFTQLYRRENGYELEELDVRNTTWPLNPGSGREKTFWFQLTPCKRPRRELNSCRVVWPGPHQVKMVRWSGRTEPWAPPTDEQVRFWAQLGVNLIVGGANYFSGDFSHPTEPEKIRHFLKTAHACGMKVIPYVTFSDYNFCAPGYPEHAADWMASLAIEFHLETTLMCFGAQGWREHFEREIDRLLSNFEFDGLYIDHWSNTRQCNNERHGCGGYLMKYVTEGYHDIAKRARRVVARHTDGKGIMLLNSGDGVFSGVLSMFDIRLMGENIDPRKVPALTLRSTYDPARQGIATLTYPSGFGTDISFINFAVSFALSSMLQVPPKDIGGWKDDGPGEPWDGYKRYWDIWRFFDINRAQRISPFRAADIARVKHPDGRVSLYLRDGKVLVVIGLVRVVDPEGDIETLDARCAELSDAIRKAGIAEDIAGALVAELRPQMNPARAAASTAAGSASREGKGGPGADRRAVEDVLEILDLGALGLSEDGRYRVLDLVAHRYVECADVRRIPVTLRGSQPQALLIEPRVDGTGARITHFTGVDAATGIVEAGVLTVTVSGAQGSPMALYLDAGDSEVTPEGTGFDVERVEGGLVRVAGRVPDGNTVRLRLS